MMKKKTPVAVEDLGEQLSLGDENVKILYQYVTRGVGESRIMKFVTEADVDMNSFSNQEKLEYALQFADADDFSYTGELNEKKQKIYTISNKKIKEYMVLYFGPDVKYTPEAEITYPFLFYINKKNEGTLTYNQSSDGYDAIFASEYDFDQHKNLIEPAYGQLVSALKQPDGSFILQERVVYTELRTENGGYAIDIYKDPGKTEKLDTKTGFNEESLKQFKVNFSDYSSTALVEYTFGLNDRTLYFLRSRIIL